jgi:hypothetical protein
MGVDLNLFSLFSLAEHIVFAISAIPYAAIFLMVIFFTLRAIVHMTDTNFFAFFAKAVFCLWQLGIACNNHFLQRAGRSWAWFSGSSGGIAVVGRALSGWNFAEPIRNRNCLLFTDLHAGNRICYWARLSRKFKWPIAI